MSVWKWGAGWQEHSLKELARAFKRIFVLGAVGCLFFLAIVDLATSEDEPKLPIGDAKLVGEIIHKG